LKQTEKGMEMISIPLSFQAVSGGFFDGFLCCLFGCFFVGGFFLRTFL